MARADTSRRIRRGDTSSAELEAEIIGAGPRSYRTAADVLAGTEANVCRGAGTGLRDVRPKLALGLRALFRDVHLGRVASQNKLLLKVRYLCSGLRKLGRVAFEKLVSICVLASNDVTEFLPRRSEEHTSELQSL